MNVKHIGIMPGAAFVLLFSFGEHRASKCEENGDVEAGRTTYAIRAGPNVKHKNRDRI
jgi:hypothetical protein